MISVQSALSLLVWLICIGLVFYLLHWLLQVCDIPEPFNKVARILLALIAVIFLVSILMNFAGTPLWRS